MKRTKEDLQKRYRGDHVFRSLVDVIASHFRINLAYCKAEVLDAVTTAEEIIRTKKTQSIHEHNPCEQAAI